MGALLSFISNLCAVVAQAFPPKPTFSVDQIPDLTGQVVIVTGQSFGAAQLQDPN